MCAAISGIREMADLKYSPEVLKDLDGIWEYFSRDAYAAMMQGNPNPENKELLIIPGAVHTDLYDRMDVIPFERMADFFRDAFEGAEGRK